MEQQSSNKTKGAGKKEFSFATKALLVLAVVGGIALIIFSLRALGVTTIGITLTTNPDLERGLVLTFGTNIRNGDLQ